MIQYKYQATLAFALISWILGFNNCALIGFITQSVVLHHQKLHQCGSESSRFCFPVSWSILTGQTAVFQPVWAEQGHWLAVTWWNTSDWPQLKPSPGSGSADPAQSSDLSRTSSMSESSSRTLVRSSVSVFQSALGMGDMGYIKYITTTPGVYCNDSIDDNSGNSWYQELISTGKNGNCWYL